MPVNTLEFSQILQKGLDQKVQHSMLTGWMDKNAGQVKYTGGNEVKIPTMAVSGLGNYKRNETGGAYANGSVDLKYKTYSMTQDRGRKFQLDAMDVDETNFVTTATSVMGLFQDEQVAPEIDAYRLAKASQYAISNEGDKNAKYGYVPANASIVEEIKLGIKNIREQGFQGQLVCHATYDVIYALEMAMVGKMTTTTFKINGIDTSVNSIDGCVLIPTPQNRLYTQINLLDGETSGQEEGGYEKATAGKTVNFIIMPTTLPIAITKQDKMRIFDPITNQNANAWSMDYRRYHDLWILENKKSLVYVNIKESA